MTFTGVTAVILRYSTEFVSIWRATYVKVVEDRPVFPATKCSP